MRPDGELQLAGRRLHPPLGRREGDGQADVLVRLRQARVQDRPLHQGDRPGEITGGEKRRKEIRIRIKFEADFLVFCPEFLFFDFFLKKIKRTVCFHVYQENI